MDDEIELAWSAGFLDGEGHFQAYAPTTGNKRIRYRIECAQVVREPLDRMDACLPGGHVRGPYGPYSSNKQAYFQWMIEGEPAFAATFALAPYLCAVKRRQARTAMSRVVGQDA